MAKPNKPYAPASPIATGSATTTHHSRPPPRRRPPPPSPSSSLLAIFATVAASASTVDGHPLSTQTPPPEFLCPQLGFSPVPTPPPHRRDVASQQTASSSLAAASSEASYNQTQEYPRSQQIADKYVSCDDGRWRKTDVWTLYGSTFCVADVCTATPTATSTTVIYGSAVITPSPSSMLPSSTRDLSEEASNYPSGWLSSKEVHNDPLTPVIITLSVVLAFAICTFIIACVIWRRKRARRLKDPEKKSQRQSNLAGEDGNPELKRFLSQQKFWAKATARWKANVRQSARRRRKRQQGSSKDVDTRLLAETSSHSSSTSLHRSYTGSSSRSAARSDGSSLPDDAIAVPPSPSAASRPDTPRPRQPPAYLSNASDTAPEARDGFQETVLPSPADSCRGMDNAAASCSVIHEQPASDDDPLPYSGFVHAGHVATDDKTLLAHMAALASAPPSVEALSPPDVPASSTTVYASVPPLGDEYEAVPFDVQVTDCDGDVVGEPSGSRGTSSPVPPSEFPHMPTYSRDHSPCPSLLPPPPTKGRMAAPTFYEYPPSFEEDVLGLEPEMGPSAPPFDEEAHSAASAPPLEIDYEVEDASVPTPTLEDQEAEEFSHDEEEVRSGAIAELAQIVQPVPLRRTASRLHAPLWHSSPPRYLP